MVSVIKLDQLPEIVEKELGLILSVLDEECIGAGRGERCGAVRFFRYKCQCVVGTNDQVFVPRHAPFRRERCFVRPIRACGDTNIGKRTASPCYLDEIGVGLVLGYIGTMEDGGTAGEVDKAWRRYSDVTARCYKRCLHWSGRRLAGVDPNLRMYCRGQECHCYGEY